MGFAAKLNLAVLGPFLSSQKRMKAEWRSVCPLEGKVMLGDDVVSRTFSFLICASSSGVKSFSMLKSFRISSGVFPLIMLALFRAELSD